MPAACSLRSLSEAGDAENAVRALNNSAVRHGNSGAVRLSDAARRRCYELRFDSNCVLGFTARSRSRRKIFGMSFPDKIADATISPTAGESLNP